MRRLLVGALLVWGLTTMHAENTIPPELAELAVFVMSEVPQRAEFDAVRARADAGIAAVSDETRRTLYLAMESFLVGFAERGSGSPEAAANSFERAIELAERVNERRETSEAYRVMSEAYNQLLDMRGTGYRLMAVGRARTAAERAVSLDERNAFAHVTAAAYFIGAPALAGGDDRRGRRHLDEAARLAPDSEYIGFLVSVWRARLAGEAGDRSAAARWIASAAAIYPRNWWLATVARELGVALPRG